MLFLPAEAMNQFTASGLILVLFGGLIAYLKSVPEIIWAWLVRQTTVTISVKDDDPAFAWTKEWLSRQDFINKIRRVDLDSTIKGKKLTLMPAPGQHVFWRHGRPFWLVFKRSDEAKGQWESRRAESLYFTTLGRKRAYLEGFVQEVLDSRNKSKLMESELYAWNEDWWERQRSYKGRSLDAVLLRPGAKEELLADIRKFLASREFYEARGIPYHRGYAFYGPPGTGKTSLVSAIGKELGMSIYIINITEMTDSKLKKAMAHIPENSIVLFEDVDAAGASKKRNKVVDTKHSAVHTDGTEDGKGLKEIFGVSLPGILNVLDGFYAPDGVIYIMTTNHIENIDPALLRPGRIDYRLPLDLAVAGQKVALYQRFFPEHSLSEAELFVKDRPTTETMADFQGLLLTIRKE